MHSHLMKSRSKGIYLSNSTSTRLTQLSESKDEFLTEVEKPMLGMLDILKRYPSIKITMDVFF